MVSVIASSVRKGNVIEKDGKLYVVLKAENIHPGKGTPVTTIEMRRIADGVKVTERYKTTESVEKAFIDELNLQLSLPGRRAFRLHGPGAFRPVACRRATWSATGRPICRRTWRCSCRCSTALPCRIVLPQRVTLEVVETEPVVKGQTASGSFKPALLSNGVRTMVPTHIVPGTRVVVMTEDGSYVERAKD